jgi:hypothetical protein
VIKKVRDEFLYSENSLSEEDCLKLYLSLGGLKEELDLSGIREFMFTDNWHTRKAEIQLKMEEAHANARQARFLKRKLVMDEKILSANDKLIDAAIDRLDDSDNLRVSDLERLSNTIGKAQGTNNEIIGAALTYKSTHTLLSNQSANGGVASIDFSKLDDATLVKVIEASTGKK